VLIELKQFDTKDLHLLKGLNTEKYLLIKSEEYCLTMGDYLTIQVKCCHLFRNSGTHTHAHSGQSGPEDGAKTFKPKRANSLSSYIYENVANMDSGKVLG